MPDKRVRILKPSKEMRNTAENSRNEIHSILPTNSVEIIGALAVPMSGKEEIDIMIIAENVESVQRTLAGSGYRIGRIVKEEGFCHKKVGSIEIEVHILPPESKIVKRYRDTVQILKNNKELRQKYDTFKLELDGATMEEYKRVKAKFMRENGLLNT